MKDFSFRVLAAVLTVPLFFAVVVFAFLHTQPVEVTITPWHPVYVMPLYLPVMIAITIGFFFGALMTWAANGRLRAKAREQKRKIDALEKQLSLANENTYKYHNNDQPSPRLLERKP